MLNILTSYKYLIQHSACKNFDEELIDHIHRGGGKAGKRNGKGHSREPVEVAVKNRKWISARNRSPMVGKERRVPRAAAARAACMCTRPAGCVYRYPRSSAIRNHG